MVKRRLEIMVMRSKRSGRGCLYLNKEKNFKVRKHLRRQVEKGHGQEEARDHGHEVKKKRSGQKASLPGWVGVAGQVHAAPLHHLQQAGQIAAAL
jgi:hypothetical protein